MRIVTNMRRFTRTTREQQMYDESVSQMWYWGIFSSVVIFFCVRLNSVVFALNRHLKEDKCRMKRLQNFMLSNSHTSWTWNLFRNLIFSVVLDVKEDGTHSEIFSFRFIQGNNISAYNDISVPYRIVKFRNHMQINAWKVFKREFLTRGRKI